MALAKRKPREQSKEKPIRTHSSYRQHPFQIQSKECQRMPAEIDIGVGIVRQDGRMNEMQASCRCQESILTACGVNWYFIVAACNCCASCPSCSQVPAAAPRWNWDVDGNFEKELFRHSVSPRWLSVFSSYVSVKPSKIIHIRTIVCLIAHIIVGLPKWYWWKK